MNKENKTVYILGLKPHGEKHYGLTTWIGDSPKYYATYDRNPGYWNKSAEIKPLGIYDTEAEAKSSGVPYSYIGFGWLYDPTTKKLAQAHPNSEMEKQ